MKLTLRPEWRIRPLASALGFLDLKIAVTIMLLFAVLNKVAGVYGLVAAFTGAGGSAAQISLYIYSVIGLAALFWGLKVTSQENAKHTLYFAHLFFADHVLSTAWLVFFAVVWWVYTPHDGRRQANSAAQEQMINNADGAHQNMTAIEREQAAMSIWHEEKGLATAAIVIGWLVKFYFAALLYSYAVHLRKGSYRSLPRSRPSPTLASTTSGLLPDEDEDDIEDFYRLPIRGPPPQPSHSRQGSLTHANDHAPSNSLGSFADFVSAPAGPGVGRARRAKPGKSNLSISLSAGNGGARGLDDAEPGEVLFDEDEGTASGDSHDEGSKSSQSRRSSRATRA